MKPRIVVLGAGFAGLELCTTLSETLGDSVDVTLIDKSDAFIFGYAKLDVLFGRAPLAAVRHAYKDFAKPGVRLLRETVTAIDPVARRVTTDAGSHDADFLVIALGADYDVSSTPGIVLGENEFYSVAGAERLRQVLPAFTKGHVVIGVCSAPYKCPPAPSECALMLHDDLSEPGDDPDIVFDDPLFFSLPINSIRFGVSGYDAKTDLCISVIWYLTDLSHTRYCSGDTGSMEPYVFIEAAKPAGCWNYGPNAETLAMRGCMDFGMLGNLADDSVDLDVDVRSDLWSGTVRFDSSP